MKVSDTPWEAFERYLLDGFDIFVGPEALIHRGREAGAVGAVSALASAFPEEVAAVVREPTEEGAAGLAALRATMESFPRHAALKRVAGWKGVRDPPRRAAAAPRSRRGGGRGARGMAAQPDRRSRRGRRRRLHRVPPRAPRRGRASCSQTSETIASGATGKALGGVRQQFSSAPEVRLARESVGFFRSLGPELFEPVGYLFLATTEAGLDELERRRETQASLGVPVERVDASRVDGPRGGRRRRRRVLRGGRDGRPGRDHARARPARRASSASTSASRPTRSSSTRTCSSSRRAPRPRRSAPSSASSFPCGRSSASSSRPPPSRASPRDLPLTIESESGFHFRRRGDALVLAMPEADAALGRDADGRRAARRGLARAHRAAVPACRRRSRSPARGRGSTT